MGASCSRFAGSSGPRGFGAVPDGPRPSRGHIGGEIGPLKNRSGAPTPGCTWKDGPYAPPGRPHRRRSQSRHQNRVTLPRAAVRIASRVWPRRRPAARPRRTPAADGALSFPSRAHFHHAQLSRGCGRTRRGIVRRNFGERAGDVGVTRSSLRALALPDPSIADAADGYGSLRDPRGGRVPAPSAGSSRGPSPTRAAAARCVDAGGAPPWRGSPRGHVMRAATVRSPVGSGERRRRPAPFPSRQGCASRRGDRGV